MAVDEEAEVLADWEKMVAFYSDIDFEMVRQETEDERLARELRAAILYARAHPYKARLLASLDRFAFWMIGRDHA